MIRTQDYFRLGTFIILGTITLVAIVIILGAGRFFETTYTVETYFDESVNGLEIGSPVKLRGVKVGRVADIDFVANLYDEAKGGEVRYVYVKCEINTSLFDEVNKKTFDKTIFNEVQHGLRVRPTSLGLTGQLFLNFVYTGTDAPTPLTLDWHPEHAYVPSVPSTLNRLEGAISSISKALESVSKEDLGDIITRFKSIMTSVDNFMKASGGQEAGYKLLAIITNVNSILERIDKLLADPATAQILPQTAGAVSGVNNIISKSSNDIIAAAADASKAMRNLKVTSEKLAGYMEDPRLEHSLDQLAPTLENITTASKDMSAAVIKVHALVNRMNAVIAGEESNVQAILEATRDLMENMRELSDDVKRYPSSVIFGTPPNKVTPEHN